MLGLAACSRPEKGDPNGRVDKDHGRRRDFGRSMSSLMEPIIDFNSSILFLRISSCKETTTVSVLDLNPRRRRASSRRGSGMSRVVRIRLRLNRMLSDVNVPDRKAATRPAGEICSGRGRKRDGAKGGTRTPTALRPQDPESCASTNSATFAARS